MVCSQTNNYAKSLMRDRITQLPGPKRDIENEAYVYDMLEKCDAIGMFGPDGELLYGWSQDNMNGWYWFCDVSEDDGIARTSYEFKQSDGSSIKVDSESEVVAKFMRGEAACLFFNGCKFHLTSRETSDEGITYAILGGAEGRGLHCAISPDYQYMVSAAASTTAMPCEYYLGIESERQPGATKRDLRELSAEFRIFAPGALGV